MAEYQTTLAFAGILAAFLAAALFLGIRERKRVRRKLAGMLRESFGRPSGKRMSPERRAQLPQYYLHHQKQGAGGFQIDDITWNDLELDRLYSEMDYTRSACGEEYLYYLLRTPAMSREELPFSQEQYDWLSDNAHTEERIRLQLVLDSLGHAGRYSFYDYIDSMSSLGERSSLPHYAAAAAPFAAFALMFLSTGIGVLVLIGVFCVNLVTYFREKRRIAPYYQVFSYVLRLLDCADAIKKENSPAFSEETDRLPALLASFASFRRGSSFFLGSAGGGSDPSGIVLEYVRLLFHLDLIKFDRMLGQFRGRQQELDDLITIVGRIDACISIASWRQTLPHCSVPDLTSFPPGMGQMPAYTVSALFHPLLQEPVANSLEAKRPVLLTGSNASGKSTFLKAAALCALLSQSVGIAPAESYRGAFFRIFTSMALRDSLQDGESYFIVEIRSLKRILLAAQSGLSGETAPAPVLCCIDEVLRGTNTVERIAASAEILRCFAESGTVCFAATHDLELTELLSDAYDNYHFGEEIEDGDVRFSFRLRRGPSTSCNAISLLGALGYDGGLVERARSRADRFLKEGTWKQEDPSQGLQPI